MQPEECIPEMSCLMFSLVDLFNSGFGFSDLDDDPSEEDLAAFEADPSRTAVQKENERSLREFAKMVQYELLLSVFFISCHVLIF